MQTHPKIELIRLKEYLWMKDEPGNIENIFMKKARRYVRFIKNIPWIKMVAVWNSVAMNNATQNSDIDLFIITSKNRLWFVRIISTFFLTILGLKKTKKNHAWKFCLSFFCTTDWMDFSTFSLENDIYLYFWIAYLKPILNYDSTFEKFIKANYSWADFSEYEELIQNNMWYIKYEWNSFWNKSKLLNIIDKILKWIFERRTFKKYEKLWKPYGIIINENMLKFHDNDKRQEISDVLFEEEIQNEL